MSGGPVLGALLPQTGLTIGALLSIDGAYQFKQPGTLVTTPPEPVGVTLRGLPVYQGLPTRRLEWAALTIGDYQTLFTIFNTKLNTTDGPVVDIVWPDPDEAGRFVAAKAVMGWPRYGGWKGGLLRDVVVELSSWSVPGQGLYLSV